MNTNFKNDTISMYQTNRLTFKEFNRLRMINEMAKFSSEKYDKYVSAVVDKLVKGQPIKLGAKGTDGEFKLDPKKDKDIIDKLRSIPGDVDEFNDILKSKKIKWTSIFKGDFSGHSEGLKSNKGNAFESELANAIADEQGEVFQKCCEYFKGLKEAGIKEIKEAGKENNKRPLTFDSNGITVGGSGDIGKTVSDITIIDNNGKEYYISAKYGNTVSFANVGIKTIIPEKWFTGEIKELPANGKALLDLFGIDEKIFKDVFNNYKPSDKKIKASKDIVSGIDLIDKNAIITLARSCMGYGYLMIHKTAKGNYEYIDLLDKSARDNFISEIKSYEILYPKNGEAKRVDIKIEFNSIIFKFNLRSKQGGLYPTHLLADYTFIH